MNGSTITAQSPEVEERTLAICDPSMIADAELPTQPLDSWWYRADWEGIEIELRRGRVVVLSVESGEVESVKTCALFMASDLLWRHDPGKGRVYLMKTPKRDRDATEPNAAARSLMGQMSAEIVALLHNEPTERIESMLRIVAKGRDWDMPYGDDRESLLDALQRALSVVPIPDLLAIKAVIHREIVKDRDADAA